MSSSLSAQQKFQSFDEMSKSVIELACSYSNCSIEELLSGSKKKEVANARSVISVYLREQGYTYKSISDTLGVDVKISHTYVKSHDNRMADTTYSTLFKRLQRSMNHVGGTDDDLREEVLKLKVSVEKLNTRLNHIYQLLTGE